MKSPDGVPLQAPPSTLATGRTEFVVDKARIFLLASGCLFAVMAADILITKFQVMTGASVPVHLGDTGQFLVLLLSVTCFVVGALFKERQAEEEGGEEPGAARPRVPPGDN